MTNAQWEKDRPFNKLENWISTQNKTGPLSYTIHKEQLKMDKRPKQRPETIELLEDNIVAKLISGCHSDFLDITPEAQTQTAKVNEQDSSN